MHQSIATLDSPEFLNLQPMDINPLMSKCEIKVLYTGENRNRTFISKEVAAEMAKTLRGAPIVGYYKEDKEDFRDHGHSVVIEDGEVRFECKTVPYGFVAPDADVWFQKFEDTDEFGNKEVREYLMTTGYLWTGQYEEANLAIEGEGRPHSMELDEKTCKGHWAENKKTGMEFFIINDAIFSKLCILGEDVEPCFEGSSVKAPSVSTSFSMNSEFKTTLFTMMQELKTALQGGDKMDMDNKIDNPTTETPEPVATEFSAEVENDTVVDAADPVVDNQAPNAFAAKTDDEDDEDKKNQDDNKEGKEEGSDTDDKTDDSDYKKCEDEEDEKKKKYELLEADFIALGKQYEALENELNTLKTSYSELETELTELRDFKLQIEDAEKDEMINKFYMLSEEDKQEVIDNKANYSLEEIENKLAVICFRKKVNFNLETEEEKTSNKTDMTFTLNDSDNGATTPAWINAVKNNKKEK